ncbi:MAG TPA: 4-alpha-glucanotransferase [Prolixibacteraceae bacterium]|nr:4-alpha-glucanotransferase [Prolixibacteraceae bacterium]
MNRSSGILLHISSLPGNYGIGSMGRDARRFVDFLVATNQKLWQILPLGPTGYGNSPYQCYSAFAGSSIFIDLDELVGEQLLTVEDLENSPSFPENRVDYDRVWEYKRGRMRLAFQNFQEKFEFFKDDYYNFLGEHSWWLDDYALFRAIKGLDEQKVWNEWKPELKKRDERELQLHRHQLDKEINFHRFLQFLFFRQWFALKQYANEKNVSIIGDIPLYVSLDSSDVWANQDIFLLDKEGQPTLVGGVPPDYFSETGQLWGNPVFNWSHLKKRNYDWWVARVHFNLRMFDCVRIDHFRGLESFWAVSATEKTAIIGEWLPANGHELLSMLKNQLGELPVIAEDLGVITPEVEKLRDDFKLPGMKILQFAFSSDEKNKDLPHNIEPNFVVYTGTHDNDTSRGWFRHATAPEKRLLKQYLKFPFFRFSRRFVEMAWSTAARQTIIPMQDLLQLGTRARMNVPGIASGNWEWRFRWKMLKRTQQGFLREITKRYNR